MFIWVILVLVIFIIGIGAWWWITSNQIQPDTIVSFGYKNMEDQFGTFNDVVSVSENDLVIGFSQLMMTRANVQKLIGEGIPIQTLKYYYLSPTQDLNRHKHFMLITKSSSSPNEYLLMGFLVDPTLNLRVKEIQIVPAPSLDGGLFELIFQIPNYPIYTLSFMAVDTRFFTKQRREEFYTRIIKEKFDNSRSYLYIGDFGFESDAPPVKWRLDSRITKAHFPGKWVMYDNARIRQEGILDRNSIKNYLFAF